MKNQSQNEKTSSQDLDKLSSKMWAIKVITMTNHLLLFSLFHMLFYTVVSTEVVT